MAEQRGKTSSILLCIESKKYSLECFPSFQWEQGQFDEKLFRVRINGTWYCPAGKYSFLSYKAIGELIATLMSGEPLVDEEPPYLPVKADVRVYLSDFELDKGGLISVAPYQRKDGRYYSQVWIAGEGNKEICCDDITLKRVR